MTFLLDFNGQELLIFDLLAPVVLYGPFRFQGPFSEYERGKVYARIGQKIFINFNLLM